MEKRTVSDFKKDLAKNANRNQAEISRKFFKTGKGEYGENEIFIGIKVSVQRKLVRNYYDLNFDDLRELLESKIYEERYCALLILTEKYRKSSGKSKKSIFDFYIKNSFGVNNWGLVDISASQIAGDFLKDRDKSILYEFAKSQKWWERRIAIVSTLAFVRDGDFEDALKISEMLLEDRQNLINKAVGWILREIGKKNQEIETEFLDEHIAEISAITLSYATEKFDKKKRKEYLAKRKTRK